MVEDNTNVTVIDTEPNYLYQSGKGSQVEIVNKWENSDVESLATHVLTILKGWDSTRQNQFFKVLSSGIFDSQKANIETLKAQLEKAEQDLDAFTDLRFNNLKDK